MSRFANPKATGRFVLPGGCQCPGTPHDEDWFEVRTELGTADILAIADARNSLERLAPIIVGWNLLDDDGQPAPVDREHIDRLYFDADLFAAFDRWTDEHVRVLALPNGSGVPSLNGSRGNATRTRATRTRR